MKQTQEDRILAQVESLIDVYAPQCGVSFQQRLLDQEAREHIARIGTSILCTKWGVGAPGGSFVQAVVDNDLMGAFGRADSINLDSIRFYVMLIYNVSYIE